MTAVHLDMMELEGDRQSGLEQPLAILSPCQEGIIEDATVLVHDTVEFRLYHSRSANQHIAFERRGNTFAGTPGCLLQIISIELLQVLCECDVEEVETSLAVSHDAVDGKLVVVEQLATLRQHIELVNLAGCLTNAPAHQHCELHAGSFADLQQTADIKRLHQRDHRHGGFHPEAECLGPTTFLGIYFLFHLFQTR